MAGVHSTRPLTAVELSPELLGSMYGCMSLIRRFEERLKWLVETGDRKSVV